MEDKRARKHMVKGGNCGSKACGHGNEAHGHENGAVRVWEWDPRVLEGCIQTRKGDKLGRCNFQGREKGALVH